VPSTSKFDALKIEAEIRWLAEARRSCSDTGVQKQIDIWVQDRQKALRKVPETTPRVLAKSA